MSAALVPLLFLAAIAVSVLASSEAFSPPAASLLIAPFLYSAGARLPAALRGASPSAAVAAAAQVVLGALFLGAAIFYFGPASASPAYAAGAALLGLLLSATDGPLTLRTAPPGAGGGSRLPAALEVQALVSVLGAVLLLPFPERLLPAGASAAGTGWALGAALDLVKGLAVGAAAGAGAAFLGRRAEAGLARASVHLAASLAAAAGAAALGGSSPLASLAAGAMARAAGLQSAGPQSAGPQSGGPQSGGAAAGGDGAEAALADDPSPSSPFAGVELLGLAGAAGSLVLAGAEVEPARLAGALTPGLAIWAGSTALRFLLQAALGGLWRWRRPWDLPAGWLPVLAWASHPGPAAAALYLLAVESGPRRQGLLGGDPGAEAAAFLIAVALGLLLQGTTAGLVVRAAGASRGRRPDRHRWERLKASRIAFRAERRAVDRLLDLGEIDGEAASSLQEALDAAERQAALASEEAAAREPALRARELARAVQAVLAAGRDAVALARSLGQVEAEAAVEVQRGIERKRARSGLLSLKEIFEDEERPT